MKYFINVCVFGLLSSYLLSLVGLNITMWQWWMVVIGGAVYFMTLPGYGEK